ncbi:ubiquitin-like protein Pup [Saccharopolyspora erythraea NRRL 2338]|uniref:Prokaryotic ubiquitin-like protein Pup 2 n=2 Tax=Saccharopolyspora erythraea TaxID=1836 RepID=PUP2_SACEN|nr:ubiquitin-like protein Pup [Saccharopolyspora erythraea]A4FCI5.1 RecName: Full=Prokaryotic ubiquitin-like protein Pup 2; AltName: Full=Bacterial ubiquitin-like modifier 2 [Saccharopolyspora erythraea NRRL 2338]EQD87430.1 ubiquitin [Saccharopolyspora erythraea D]PFG95523.1 ubiquitin-like protein Pup [Saccharopolyspora erythraea NRRL 2338]QRK92148.1 ubiquitin-like protein Pup [Saccharopolyspora erythraea]CAM01760.1 hypothetical protein SACE_2462 [Saccharopolyspora erythraea NRRL 2338]
MRQEKPKRHGREDDEPPEPAPAGRARDTTVGDDTDELLDEIDGVLEENAVEFVRSYIQKGGE